MNYFTKKASAEPSDKGNYHNSFRGTNIKKTEEKPKILESISQKPTLIFDNKEKNEAGEQKKAQPKLLTSKLPSAFTLGSNAKTKRNENTFIKKNSNVKEGSRPSLEHQENNFISLTEEACTPHLIRQEFEEKNLKLPIQVSTREKQSRNSSKSTKSDPKSTSQNQFLSDNDCIEHNIKSMMKDKTSTENIRKKYLSPDMNSNEMQKLINYDFSSNDSAKKHRNPKTHDSFFPKIKNNFSETLDAQPTAKYNSNNSNHIFLTTDGDCSTTDFKLEDCITMNVIKHSFGKIKKMLYVNQFEIVVVKEIPLSSKSYNANIKEKLSEIKNKLNNSQKLVKVYKEFLNTPEGSMSVAMEYMNGFSLQETVENIGCLSEPLIRNISLQLVDSLDEHLELLGSNYGELSLCDILLNKTGLLKLLPNVFKPVKYSSQENIQRSRCGCVDIFHKKQSKIIDLKSTLYNDKLNNNFISAIVSSSGMKFPHLDYIENNSKQVEKEIKSKKICCFFHLILSLDSVLGTEKYKIGILFNDKNFSPKFFDFLCLLTNFNKEKHKDITIRMLKNHIWFKEHSLKSKIRLSEIVKLTREWKRAKAPQSDGRTSIFENSLNMIVSKNMEHYKETSPYIINNKLMYSFLLSGDFASFMETRKQVIKELSMDLFIQPIILYNKLKEIISEYSEVKFI